MQLETSHVNAVEECVQSLVDSQSPSDIFKALLKGSQSAAPRGAIFLVRQGILKGWGSIGYDEDVARAQRTYRTDADQGWLGELVKDPDGAIRVRSSGGNPDFGQAAPSDSAGIAVRVRGRTIAVLMAERSSGETLWLPSTLGTLVAVAQLRLELDLALRKLKSGAPSIGPASPPEGDVAGTEPIVDSTLVEPATATEIDEVPEAAKEDAEVVVARRFAKLVATDIRLYNEDAVLQGRQDKDLADRLADQLGRGKETFLKRHGSMGSAAIEILHEAFVEVLAGGDAELLPVSILD